METKRAAGGSRWQRLRAEWLLVGLLVACSSPGKPAATVSPATVAVQLNSFSVTPNIVTVQVGTVTFNINNIAKDDAHEFVVIYTELAPDKLPVGSDKMVDEAALTVVAQLPGIDPGKTGQVIANLYAGQYVIICNRPDHYRQGMHAAFTVLPH